MTNPVAVVRGITHNGKHYDTLAFWCPGCEHEHGGQMVGGLHMLPVNTTEHSPSWDWDGNLEAPTLNPSILTKYTMSGQPFVCHSFMRAGRMEFLSDCTHKYAGQTVPLPPLPDWVIEP